MEPGARGQSAALSGTSHDHARRTSAQVNRHFGWLRMGAPGRVPPAGFEPALTAPEADPVHRFYLAKRTVPVRLGSVWGERRIRIAGPGCSHIFRPASGPGGARIVVSSVVEYSYWCCEQSADRRCRPAGRSREEAEAGPWVSRRISRFALTAEFLVGHGC